ncbi:MAG: GNAT family N-acetyltransferase [Chloroflexi bacterium]|nr:GNAT family N-acetyltransferase [Chloroflexota bacterium]
MAYHVRPATDADQPAITALVRGAGINPFSLYWPRFLVAEDAGRVIGVAQIKPHGDGSRELASLAVAPDRQGARIGSALVAAWLARERGTLYLMCADRLENYYARFGFRRIDTREMPPYFRRMVRVANIIARVATLFGQPRQVIVMRRQQAGVTQYATKHPERSPAVV